MLLKVQSQLGHSAASPQIATPVGIFLFSEGRIESTSGLDGCGLQAAAHWTTKFYGTSVSCENNYDPLFSLLLKDEGLENTTSCISY